MLQQFNRKIAKNKTLRERIDKTRSDRATFDRIFHKMETAVLGFDTSIAETKQKTSELEETLKRERAELESKRLEGEESTDAFERKWKKVQSQLEDAKLENTLEKEKLRSTLVGDNKVTMMSKSSKMTMSAISALSSVHQWQNTERKRFFEYRRRENKDSTKMSMKDLQDYLEKVESETGEDPVLTLEQSEDEQYRTFLQIMDLKMQTQEQLTRVEMLKKRIQDALPEAQRAEERLVRELEEKKESTRKSTEETKASVSNMKSEIEGTVRGIEELLQRVLKHEARGRPDQIVDTSSMSFKDKLARIQVSMKSILF